MPGKVISVIGIGASAGGMDTLVRLFSHLPADTGAAFVLTLHPSPPDTGRVHSMLAESTAMPVADAGASTPTELRPDHIYIISGGRDLVLESGLLVVRPRLKLNYPDQPIDHFFHSLGKDLRENAVGLLVSGTESAGGIRAIKEAGGLCLVLSPTSEGSVAPHRAMSQRQLADRVLGPAEMALLLAEIIRKQARAEQSGKALMLPWTEAASAFLSRVLMQVQAAAGLDFSAYEEANLVRRLANRMLLHRLDDPEEYLQLLSGDKREAQILQKDFLVGTTRFFRNREAFRKLQMLVLPQLLSAAPSTGPIRIWAPACATGEEAYSIALIISEYLHAQKLDIDFKIFATDVDQNAIRLAAEGVFPYSSAADLPQELQDRYFTRESDYFRIRAGIRDKMLFAVHNLLCDPPFIHIDLISCRNTLRYFKAPAQHSVLSTFHFALKDRGYLFLGHTESPGEMKHAYKAVDKKWRIFQKGLLFSGLSTGTSS